MKICLINNLYAPWERGGAEKIVAFSARGLARVGHEVFVISTAPEDTKSDNVYFLKSIFYNLASYPVWQRLFWHLWDFFSPAHLGRIKKILDEEKPDLVITHNLKGVGLSLPRVLKKKHLRHFHVLHDIQLLHPSGLMFWGREKAISSPGARLYQFFSRQLFGSPALVISPSRWLLGEHEKKGFFRKSRKVILPNFFGSGAGLSQPEPSGDKFVFLFVGQLEKHKGVDFLAKAFLGFSAKNPAVKAELVVAGDGRLLADLKRLSVANPHLKVLGRQTEVEVRDLMLAANCLVVPSLCYENSPTVIYEAAAVLLPVLASRLGGITELIEGAGGWLFEPGNAAELIDKMERLVFSPEELEIVKKKEGNFKPVDYLANLEALAESKG